MNVCNTNELKDIGCILWTRSSVDLPISNNLVLLNSSKGEGENNKMSLSLEEISICFVAGGVEFEETQSEIFFTLEHVCNSIQK